MAVAVTTWASDTVLKPFRGHLPALPARARRRPAADPSSLELHLAHIPVCSGSLSFPSLTASSTCRASWVIAQGPHQQ